MNYIPTETLERAASRLEEAARQAHQAADRIESLLHQLRVLTEPGYGNNVSLLINLLEGLDAEKYVPPSPERDKGENQQ